MKKLLCALLLFGFPLSLSAQEGKPPTLPASPWMRMSDLSVAQRETPPAIGRPDAPPPRREDTSQREGNRPAPEAQVLQEVLQELQRAFQELQRITQKSLADNNPLAQELQNAVQNLQRVLGRAIIEARNVPAPSRPAAQPLPAQNGGRNPLNADREKAYIELARQYFYVYATTMDPVPVVKSPLPPAAPPPSDETAPAEIALAEEENAKEPEPSEREKVLANFVECMKKISPAAQIALINELIRSAHSNDELKLLEGLLDEVTAPPVLQPPGGRAVPGQAVPILRPRGTDIVPQR